MKIALITDTHFGVRNDNQIFHDYFKRFYETVFFPYLDEHGITTVIHLGDLVDRRKYVNFLTANKLYETFIKPLSDRNIDFHCIIGNHDIYFRNNLHINALNEIYRNNPNVKIVDKPTELDFAGLRMLLVPWICNENYNDCFNAIHDTNADILLGHLELNGFEMYRGSICEQGHPIAPFRKFEYVFSGHFHHKSHDQNIHYLGAPYEMTWSDYNDDRGFHAFDTETKTLEFIKNPLSIFNRINYDDTEMSIEDLDDIDFETFENTYVKMVVQEKANPYLFDMFVDRVQKSGVANLQIIEDFSLDTDNKDAILDEAKSTIEILEEYVDSVNVKSSKKELTTVFRNLYQEAINQE